MERITDKLRKLLALAERGCGGEAENAKRLLEAQLRRYGMTLEDLLNEGKKKRAFKYRNKEEMKIIIHVLLAVLGSKAEARRKRSAMQHIVLPQSVLTLN